MQGLEFLLCTWWGGPSEKVSTPRQEGPAQGQTGTSLKEVQWHHTVNSLVG